jgi:DNA repair protein RadC
MINSWKVQLVKEPGYKYKTRRIKTPEEVYQLAREYISVPDREHFVIVALDTRNKVIGLNTASIGTLDEAKIHPREIFKYAILANAASIILVHNHPSGEPEASGDDIKLTKRVHEAGELIGIDIVDHVILGEDKLISMKREGLI